MGGGFPRGAPRVYALDAKTGRELWKYDPKVPKAKGRDACCDVVNRGVAVWKGRVYVGTIDGRLVALDATTGEPVWDVLTVDPSQAYTITGAPRILVEILHESNGEARHVLAEGVVGEGLGVGNQGRSHHQRVAGGNVANCAQTCAVDRIGEIVEQFSGGLDEIDGDVARLGDNIVIVPRSVLSSVLLRGTSDLESRFKVTLVKRADLASIVGSRQAAQLAGNRILALYTDDATHPLYLIEFR